MWHLGTWLGSAGLGSAGSYSIILEVFSNPNVLWFCSLSVSYISKSYKYSPCSPPAFIQTGYSWTVCPKWNSGFQVTKVRKSLHVTVLFWIQVQCWASSAASKQLFLSSLRVTTKPQPDPEVLEHPVFLLLLFFSKYKTWLLNCIPAFQNISSVFKVIWTVSKHIFSPSKLDNV